MVGMVQSMSNPQTRKHCPNKEETGYQTEGKYGMTQSFHHFAPVYKLILKKHVHACQERNTYPRRLTLLQGQLHSFLPWSTLILRVTLSYGTRLLPAVPVGIFAFPDTLAESDFG